MAEIPTLKIKHGESYCVINEEDFDSKTMTKYEAQAKASPNGKEEVKAKK